MVKLSRTSFGFFNLTGLSAFGPTDGLKGALTTEADFLAAGLAVALEAALGAGVAAALGWDALAAAAFTELADALCFVVVTMWSFS